MMSWLDRFLDWIGPAPEVALKSIITPDDLIEARIIESIAREAEQVFGIKRDGFGHIVFPQYNEGD